MPYDNEYNRTIAKQILKANEEYIKRSSLVGEGLSGGFIEHLSNALYQHHLSKHKKGHMKGRGGFASSMDASGGEEKSDGVDGSIEGGGMLSRPIGGGINGQHRYKKTSQSKLEVANIEREGGNWLSDIGQGFMSVVKPVAGMAREVLRVIPDKRAQMASAVLDGIGAGKKKRGRPTGSKKVHLIPQSEMHSSSMSGMGYSGGGESGGGRSGGGRSGGGGRSVRAGIVKDIMKKRGVSMIEASKIVKAEGLYSPK
jgi:hypothetical protein